jgi:hypothetical protein
MVFIKEIETTSVNGVKTTYVEMATEKREALVSFCPSNVFPIAVYTTKALSAGRTFKNWEEAVVGYKNANIVEMIETAKRVVS